MYILSAFVRNFTPLFPDSICSLTSRSLTFVTLAVPLNTSLAPTSMAASNVAVRLVTSIRPTEPNTWRFSQMSSGKVTSSV